MSTIVYQELQLCCNSNIDSRTLSLRVNNPSNLEKSSSNGGWSSIETLPSKVEAIYVHPLVKRSSYMLNEKSLQMCTESLGCETGTCDMVSLDSLFPSSSSSSSSTIKTTMKVRTPRQKFDIKKQFSFDQGKFPPPLTTISGSSNTNIRVKQYREDGRLVIEAVSSPTVQPCMQAERCDGRLKLSMLRVPSSDINDNDNDNDNDNEDNCQENSGNGVENELVQNQEKRVGKEEYEECNKSDANMIEDMNGIKLELRVKLGKQKIQRPTRCKERGQRLINWEPFWVAT